MAIARNLNDLPKPAKLKADGWAPDPEPRFVHLLAERWTEDNAERDREYLARPHARFHLSSAGGCARSIALSALRVESSDPMDLSGIHNTRLGSILHELWQGALAERYPDAQIEFRSVILDGDGSGYADAVVTMPDGTVIVIEFKSIGGFGFKMAIGERGTAQGPKHEHVLQAALNAKAIGADQIVIAYLAKEAVSVNVAKKKGFTEAGRFCAEWSMDSDEFEPLAAAEEARITGILTLLDEGTLPARKIPSPEIPSGAVIVDPGAGRWELRGANDTLLDTGTHFLCAYCRYQTLCTPMPSGRCATSEIPVTVGASS